ncbi:MAG: T9SS type A sorting domain-containing protein [Ignavibacteriales bacterium]|nr:T9SS type A sorting domain-containing protein [Ignavibacteriales bacterium]
MKNIRLFIMIFILSFNNLFSYGYLYVNNPKGWFWGQGTIEEAIISIQPKGMYVEYGFYLTFSAKNYGLTNQDTLEAVYDFDLPENSIVTDSWLWIGEDIIRGKILDRWTASQIYEGIVNRRRDPSVLYKQYENHYQLKVYPLPANESRKIKLTFLVPAVWSSKFVESSIPIELLKAGYIGFNNVFIINRNSKEWKNPKLLEFPEKNFEQKYDEKLGNYFETSFSSSELQNKSAINFIVDAPFNNGLYLSKFEGKDENLYQLAYLPASNISIQNQKRAAILVDFDASKTSLSKEEILQSIKTVLYNQFSENDYFNIIFSNLAINRLSENWIKADSSTINSVFNNISSNNLSNYSNLPALLSNGINFINTSEGNGEIILLANSEQVGESEVANDLIKDLSDMMDKEIKINIGDYIENNYNWYYINNRSYRGNEYFYENLSRITGGNFKRVDYNYSYNTMVNEIFESLGILISSYDLHTSMSNGFCFGRINQNVADKPIYLNTPIIQVGKYSGDFPFKIEFNGLYNNTPFSEKFEFNADEIRTGDSVTAAIWAGNFINNLEQDNNYYYLTNDEINEIIDFSIKNRVLSYYTAFLCLEPSLGGEIFYLAEDESDLVNDIKVTDETQADTLFQAYPNPFNNETNIKIRLGKKIDPESATFKIYNVLGQVVKTFQPNIKFESNEFEFLWNGLNDNNSTIASGNYFFVMNYKGKVRTLKLALVK